MSLAPVILFVYNRPEHTLQTLRHLQKNLLSENSELFIYSDGAKENESESDSMKVARVREIIRSEKWCGSIHITESKENSGLAASIISGVTEIISKHGKAIVLEDDMITSKFFLKFLNDALDLYEAKEEVACISAYVPPARNLPETFFIKGADCWGWATWKRSWNLFEPDGKKLLAELQEKHLGNEFDFNNAYPYMQMLSDQVKQKNDSWAIRWYASAFLENKLLLYPGKSFVQNIGNDSSGFHGFNSDIFKVKLSGVSLSLTEIPAIENSSARKILENFYRTQHKNESLSKKIKYKINALFRKNR